MNNEKLRKELAKVLASNWGNKQTGPYSPCEFDYILAEAILASGIIQREVDEAVAGAYLAAAKVAPCDGCTSESPLSASGVHRPKWTRNDGVEFECVCSKESIKKLTTADARAAFDEAVKREKAALIAELEAELKDWRASADITGALDLSAYRRVCANRLAAVLAKHKPQPAAEGK